MAPIVYPPLSRQVFSIKDEGVFTLTPQQLAARSLIITVEKVITGFVYDYYNFSTPEPETQWGYLQLMARDFVMETQQLQYRRQTVKFWDNPILDPIEQLRCMLRTSTLLLFELVADAQAVTIIDDASRAFRRAEYRIAVDTPRLIPSQGLTAIWYKVDVGRSAFVTIEWEGYAPISCPFPAPQFAPTANPPAKGESQSSGGGTGGTTNTRDPGGPPQDQQSDPGSDNPGPTPGANVPESPTPQPPAPPIPPPGRWTVFYENKLWSFSSATGKCTMRIVPGQITGRGPYLMTTSQNALGTTFTLLGSDGSRFDTLAGVDGTTYPGCPGPQESVIANQVRLSD
jgi:hypothetical protein